MNRPPFDTRHRGKIYDPWSNQFKTGPEKAAHYAAYWIPLAVLVGGFLLTISGGPYLGDILGLLAMLVAVVALMICIAGALLAFGLVIARAMR